MSAERPRVRVKICGITSVADARRAVELGADFLGLNFYPASPRFLDAETAREIAGAVGESVRLVGVFAGADRDEIERIDALVGLDLLQFHGGESDQEIAPFESRAIRVLRVAGDLEARHLEGSEGCWGVLLDSYHRDLLGGTGATWSWSLARALSPRRHLFVAGGITPENARSAAGNSNAWALDVCSGVESSPGRKDWGKMERLFEALSESD